MAVSRALKSVFWRSRWYLARSMGQAWGGFYLLMEELEGGLGDLKLIAGSVARPISVSSARRILSRNGEGSITIN